MTHSRSFTRRATLGLAAGASVAALAPALSSAPVLAGTGGTLAESAVRLFSSPHHARRVGLCCVRYEEPTQALAGGIQDREALVDEIFGADRERFERAGDVEIHGWLRDRVRRDFLAGRTVSVDGWILSRTEAGLYALSSIV